jgi:6-pyruvoyltetrahydropterin/6-carboxytetrahydropterin synthase
MEYYSIFVEKDEFQFSAAHFVTFNSDCEKLHGHNYRVSVKISGSICKTGLLFDFTILRKLTKQICKTLDHKILLPKHSHIIKITEKNRQIEVRINDKFYSFPETDVLLLPIENCSAELLAKYISIELERSLARHHLSLLEIEVGVSESTGQTAFFKKTAGNK